MYVFTLLHYVHYCRISYINERERIVTIREKNVECNEDGKGFWLCFNEKYATDKATKKYAR